LLALTTGSLNALSFARSLANSLVDLFLASVSSALGCLSGPLLALFSVANSLVDLSLFSSAVTAASVAGSLSDPPLAWPPVANSLADSLLSSTAGSLDDLAFLSGADRFPGRLLVLSRRRQVLKIVFSLSSTVFLSPSSIFSGSIWAI
jgi:hypothetical protein